MPASRNSAARGGIDLGGTKIEAVVVDARQHGARLGAPPDADDRRSRGRRRRDDRGGEGRLRRPPVSRPTPCAASASARPAWSTTATGAVSTARNLPDWEGSFELGAALSTELGTTVFVGNDVQVATDAEFKLGAGKPYKSLLGVFWGTGVGGGLILDGKPWLGRGGAGEIGHMVVEIGGRPLPVRPARLHGGLRRPRRDGGARAQAQDEGQEDRPVQADEGARPHAR